MKMNEGASILLAWIINLVKWNAGTTRYRFQSVASSPLKQHETNGSSQDNSAHKKQGLRTTYDD